MLFTMIIITLILLIISTLALVGSAYYSERNYKAGRFLWRTSVIVGAIYGCAGTVTIGMGAYKILEYLF
ncbi:MAG: hypothetical protein ACRCX2_08325 [Paraclostridium sp.]